MKPAAEVERQYLDVVRLATRSFGGLKERANVGWARRSFRRWQLQFVSAYERGYGVFAGAAVDGEARARLAHLMARESERVVREQALQGVPLGWLEDDARRPVVAAWAVISNASTFEESGVTADVSLPDDDDFLVEALRIADVGNSAEAADFRARWKFAFLAGMGQGLVDAAVASPAQPQDDAPGFQAADTPQGEDRHVAGAPGDAPRGRGRLVVTIGAATMLLIAIGITIGVLAGRRVSSLEHAVAAEANRVLSDAGGRADVSVESCERASEDVAARGRDPLRGSVAYSCRVSESESPWCAFRRGDEVVGVFPSSCEAFAQAKDARRRIDREAELIRTAIAIFNKSEWRGIMASLTASSPAGYECVIALARDFSETVSLTVYTPSAWNQVLISPEADPSTSGSFAVETGGGDPPVTIDEGRGCFVSPNGDVGFID